MDFKAAFFVCSLFLASGHGFSVERVNDEFHSIHKRDAAAIDIRKAAMAKLGTETMTYFDVWRKQEEDFAEVLESVQEIADETAEFVADELSLGSDVGEVLPEEIAVIRKLFQASELIIKAVQMRMEFYDSGISNVEHWRTLIELEEFQVAECRDIIEAGLENGYDLDISFNSLEVVFDGIKYMLNLYIKDVYFEWSGCALRELASLNQGSFTGYDCEHEVAKDKLFHETQLQKLIQRLISIGADMDRSVENYESKLENFENPNLCIGDTDGLNLMIATIKDITVLRRENEQAMVDINETFIDAVTQWLESFETETKKDTMMEVDSKLAIKKLLMDLVKMK